MQAFKQITAKTIGVVEIAGGVLGALLSVIMLFKALQKVLTSHAVDQTQIVLAIVVPFVFLVVFIVAIRAGLLLFRQHERGYQMSIVLQILQTPVIVMPKFAYNFVLGLQFAVGFVKQQSQYLFQTNHFFGSYFWLRMSSPIEFGFYINLVSLLFVILLLFTMRIPLDESS